MTLAQRIWIAAAFSAAGRYSLIWLAGAALGAIFGADRSGFLVFTVALVIEWAVTNGPIKMMFERERPDNSGVIAFIPAWLKPPRSSSFPSGHSSAAAFSTVIWWAWNPAAGIVSTIIMLGMTTSRIVIRAHHKTDVAAGVLWGGALAAGCLLVARDLFPT